MDKLYLDDDRNNVIYSSFKPDCKYRDDSFSNIDIKYREYVNYFYRKLKLGIGDKYLDLFFNNIGDVKIKKNVLMGIVYDTIHSFTYASYDITKNSIFLYRNKFSSSDLYHELLHLSSSFYLPNKNICYCGLSQNNDSMSIGTAINEGYTEYLCSLLFGIDNNSYYQYEMVVIQLLELIVGPNNMKDIYFSGDTYGLFNILLDLNSFSRVRNFFSKTDYILDKRKGNIINKEKINKYMFDVNFFLIDTYRNLLVKLYNNGSISSIELYELYRLFMDNIRVLLDIELPINKDILSMNISDNDNLHMNKIKKLI